MLEIGAFEARKKLGNLLDLVQQGEEIFITRHGQSVTRLVPNTARRIFPRPANMVSPPKFSAAPLRPGGRQDFSAGARPAWAAALLWYRQWYRQRPRCSARFAGRERRGLLEGGKIRQNFDAACSCDLTKKGGEARIEDYIKRTLLKAAEQINRRPTMPRLPTRGRELSR